MTPPPVAGDAVTIAAIQLAVCERFGLKFSEMQSKRRQRVLSRPRQIAMYLSRELTARSLPEIGRLFGNRDHTTVLHACRKVEALADADPKFARTVIDLGLRLTLGEVDPNQLLLPLDAE